MAKQMLKIGVGNFPPFFIEKENKGLFIEITEKIFEQLPEYDISFIFMSNHRLLYEINTGTIIDVACNIFPDSQVNAHLSEPIFRFTDVAISNKSSNINIETISDLQGLSIAAYQGAKELLGNDFKKMALSNSSYTEHPQPKETSYLMISGSKDVRVGDISIFLYDLQNRYYQDVNADNFTVHHLWPDVYSHMAFKDEALKNTVNKVITKLTKDGTIENIYAKFEAELSPLSNK